VSAFAGSVVDLVFIKMKRMGREDPGGRGIEDVWYGIGYGQHRVRADAPGGLIPVPPRRRPDWSSDSRARAAFCGSPDRTSRLCVPNVQLACRCR
jgi:hypothetical protein